jgi:hypothetical protein
MEASFTPVLPGSYNFTLTVRDDRGAWSVEDTVNVTIQEADVNVPPVAEIAGAAVQSAHVGDNITLDGSSSRDDDGTILEYVWNCTSHPSLSFTGQNTTSIYFQPNSPGDYVFTLAVMDDNMTWSLNEDSVTIQVTRPSENTLPVAVIDGPAVKVRPGDDVALDGSASYDPDGIITGFTWECLSHPTLVFTGQNTSAVIFNVPDVGDYTFTLSVKDDQDEWSTTLAHFTVSVKVNLVPVANITGPDYGLPGQNITLSAENSYDDDGTIVAWRWNCTSHEELNMTGDDMMAMNFTPTMADTYVFKLVVQDDEDEWSPWAEWTIVINPIDQIPVADAGPDMQVRIGNSVDLNGGESYDYEGEITEWLWKCTSHPTVPGLVDVDLALASFTPPEPGTFVFSLEVMDEAGQWSDPDSMTITVLPTNSRPVITIISPKSGDQVTLGADHLLRIMWETEDVNDDMMMYQVEILKEGTLQLVVRGNLPHGTNNVTFNDTNLNFPRGVELEAWITCTEIDTEDRYVTTALAGPFIIKDAVAPPNNGGGGNGDGLSMNTILLAVILLLALMFVGFIVMRRGPSDDEEVPWADEHAEAKSGNKPSGRALATKGGSGATAAAQKATVESKKPKGDVAKDPQGRLLDCPQCGAPLDHDTDFGSPYCWDCDKYY